MLPLHTALYTPPSPTELAKEVKSARNATVTQDICSSIFLPLCELAQGWSMGAKQLKTGRKT